MTLQVVVVVQCVLPLWWYSSACLLVYLSRMHIRWALRCCSLRAKLQNLPTSLLLFWPTTHSCMLLFMMDFVHLLSQVHHARALHGLVINLRKVRAASGAKSTLTVSKVQSSTTRRLMMIYNNTLNTCLRSSSLDAGFSCNYIALGLADILPSGIQLERLGAVFGIMGISLDFDVLRLVRFVDGNILQRVTNRYTRTPYGLHSEKSWRQKRMQRLH